MSDHTEEQKIDDLVNQIAEICDHNGWDFFCLLATDVNSLHDYLILAGNDFIARSTIQSYTASALLQKILRPDAIQSESIGPALSSHLEKQV